MNKFKVIDGKIVYKQRNRTDCFDCEGLGLITLKNCPEKVGGSFYCSDNKLTTLKSCPEKVGGSFYCSDNKLTTLKSCPKEVGNSFICSGNKLTTLEDVPERIDGDFDCGNNNLITLKGCPKVVSGDFDCDNNDLITLKGCPKVVYGKFHCYYNNRLKDISDLPSMIYVVDIEGCYYIEVFTKEITNEDGILTFDYPSDKVRERIRQWPCYDVVEEDEDSITVRIKPDNELFMDTL